MSVRIVTHCYARTLPQFAEHLKFQLSSLLLYPPECKVQVSVCASPHDRDTLEVIKFFQKPEFGSFIKPVLMEEASLFRRSIGRNIEGITAQEELVWFTDVDHVFGKGCIDEVFQGFVEMKSKIPDLLMIYPRQINIQNEHHLGDTLVKKTKDQGNYLVDIDSSEFSPKGYNRAIGGVQITDGNFCRNYGYLNHSKRYQAPRTDGKPFRDFRDDIAFRNFVAMHGKVKSISVNGLYRIRHTLTTYGG